MAEGGVETAWVWLTCLFYRKEGIGDVFLAYPPKELVTLMVNGPATWASTRPAWGAGVIMG